VTTAIVSDLHLGTTLGADVVRRPDARERLADALRQADEVVFLGDLLELRELPLERVLEAVRPILADLAPALAGKRVTVVSGNHDHKLVEPYLDRLRLDGAPLELEWTVTPDSPGLAAELARLFADSELVLAYPGVRPRPDVYALHGHYLDLHLSVPRIESVLGSAVARLALGRDAHFHAPDDYERALAPMYAFSYGLAQGAAGETIRRSNNLSRAVWDRARADGRTRVSGFLLGRVAIPAGVAALNLAGLGPYRTKLTGIELRRAGLRAIAQVVENLGVEADHVVFGHTHRGGPRPDEEAEWRSAAGARLWNAGSWFFERVLAGDRPRESPYWPGGVLYVRDEGPPELVNVLRDVSLEAPAAQRA
jgi:predicted phosphodiesterase